MKRSFRGRMFGSVNIRALWITMLMVGFVRGALPVNTAAEMKVLPQVDQRLAMEQAAKDNPFLLLPHRPNYALPITYNRSPNEKPFGLPNGAFDRLEMKFQVSLKIQLADSVFGTGGKLYAAYTNCSWWQAFNAGRSRPFRETNHEPELFVLFNFDREFLGLQTTNIILGADHESNGQSGLLSRSWNRIYGALILQKDNFLVRIKPWYRIPERKKKSPDDPGGDDNPDIEEYMGSGELSIFYRGEKQAFSLMVRNNLESPNRGAVELGWTYPLFKTVKGYIQIFDGYGESLIDYNHRTTRLGAGFLLADWLQ